MKIHKTQNLNSLVQTNQQTTNNSVSKDFRLKNFSEQMLMPKLSAESADFYSSSITFGKKVPNIKEGKKIIKATSKKVGIIRKEPNPEKKRGDKFLTGSFFNGTLDVVDYETVATALVAAGACGARGATILAIPTKKNKDDNTYAAGQAWASGIVGFGTAFALTAPFKAGSNYVMKEMKQHLSAKTLERLWPQIDKYSIVNAKGTKEEIEKLLDRMDLRKPIDEWLDKEGNKFVEEMKDCDKLPELMNLADVSEKTFSQILLKNKAEVDWASQKGKSFNDIVLKDGKKFYDEIDMSNLGIIVQEEGMNKSQIMLKDINKDFFKDMIAQAKKDGNHWGDLDIKSVYDKDNSVIDFRHWKDLKGNQWKLNLNEVGVSSPYETAEYRPRISGKKRLDPKENVNKYVTSQKNGRNGKRGTEINNDMVVADTANDGLFKLLTWGPDLLFRVPVAATTIAIIPWLLRNVFHLHKSTDKQNNKKDAVQKQIVNNAAENTNIKTPEAVTFKGKGGASDKAKESLFKRILKPFAKKFGELYGKPLIENERVHKVSAWLSRLPGNVTQHMTAFGSLITSGVYVQQTLTKKDLDPERRRTLAVNQGLCFIVPTLAAYTVDKLINSWVKNKGYRYSGLNERKIDIDRIEGKEAKKVAEEAKVLAKKIKGIRTLSSITIFAFIYRYATPVLITPLANKIGDRWNAKIAAKKQAHAKEIALDTNYDKKENETDVAKEVALGTVVGKETKKVA